MLRGVLEHPEPYRGHAPGHTQFGQAVHTAHIGMCAVWPTLLIQKESDMD